MMDISQVQWWSKKSTDTTYFIVVMLLLLLLFLLVKFIRQRKEKQRKETRFYNVVDRYKMNQDQEDLLVDLVEKSELPEPEEILLKKDLFDSIVSREVDSIITGSGTITEKMGEIDRLYELRKKVQEPLFTRKKFEQSNIANMVTDTGLRIDMKINNKKV